MGKKMEPRAAQSTMTMKSSRKMWEHAMQPFAAEHRDTWHAVHHVTCSVSDDSRTQICCRSRVVLNRLLRRPLQICRFVVLGHLAIHIFMRHFVL